MGALEGHEALEDSAARIIPVGQAHHHAGSVFHVGAAAPFPQAEQGVGVARAQCGGEKIGLRGEALRIKFAGGSQLFPHRQQQQRVAFQGPIEEACPVGVRFNERLAAGAAHGNALAVAVDGQLDPFGGRQHVRKLPHQFGSAIERGEADQAEFRQGDGPRLVEAVPYPETGPLQRSAQGGRAAGREVVAVVREQQQPQPPALAEIEVAKRLVHLDQQRRKLLGAHDVAEGVGAGNVRDEGRRVGSQETLAHAAQVGAEAFHRHDEVQALEQPRLVVVERLQVRS